MTIKLLTLETKRLQKHIIMASIDRGFVGSDLGTTGSQTINCMQKTFGSGFRVKHFANRLKNILKTRFT